MLHVGPQGPPAACCVDRSLGRGPAPLPTPSHACPTGSLCPALPPPTPTSLSARFRSAAMSRSPWLIAAASLWWVEMASSNWACRAFSSAVRALMVAWGEWAVSC